MTISFSQEIYDRIVSLLGLPQGSEKIYWEIEDHIEGTDIYLLHYLTSNVGELIETVDFKPKYDRVDCETILKLRGLIVDLEEGWICCMSNPHTNEVVLEGKELIADNNMLNLEDKFGVVYGEKVDSVRFLPSYGGPLVRVWKYKGVTHLSSHHRISIAKSKWGTQKYFEQMFIDDFVKSHRIFIEGKDNHAIIQEIGNVLFDSSKPTSNTCHAFMIVSPDIVNDTRMDIGEGFLIYLNSFTLNQFYNEQAFLHYALHKDIEYKNTWVDKEDFYYPSAFSRVETNKIVKLRELPLQDANRLLSTGFYNKSVEGVNEDLLPGESVISVLSDGRILKIIPNSVDWRAHILNNNPDLYKQFCMAMNKSLEKEQGVPYEEMFHDLGYPTAKELEKFSHSMMREGVLIPPVYVKEKVDKKGNMREKEREWKRRNIALNFLYAVPHSMIEEAGEFYTFYLQDIADLEKFMMKNYVTLGNAIREGRLQDDKRFTGENKELNNAGKALERILTNAAEYVDVRRKEGKDTKWNPKMRKDEKMTDREIIEQNIKNLLQNERGSGLYALFRAIAA
jgi:hypothetical protein